MKQHITNKNGDCTNCGQLAVEGDGQKCPAKRTSGAPLLIHKKQVKEYALSVSKSQRGGKFTRVSNEFFIYIESCVKEKIQSYVRGLPSVGKTIK